MKLFIFIILIFIVYFLSSKIYKFYHIKNINKVVNKNIILDKKKTPIFKISNELKNLSKLWTIDYLIEKEKNNILSVTKMKNNILNFFKNTREIKMNGELFFKIISRDENCKLYYAQREMSENLKKNIFYPPNIKKNMICNIVCWIGAGKQFTPLHFDHDDGYLCIIKGSKRVRLINPKYSNKIKPLKCLMYSKYLNIEDIDEKIDYLEYTLREGDYLFIPAGWWHDVKTDTGFNIAYTIWLNCFEGKYNYDKVVRKLELLQYRDIPKMLRPKDLDEEEIKKLWDANLINGNNWEKNLWINNPMYTEIYD